MVLTTTKAVRMQFYAIEIARWGIRSTLNPVAAIADSVTLLQRNRAGLNDWIYDREHPGEDSDKL